MAVKVGDRVKLDVWTRAGHHTCKRTVKTVEGYGVITVGLNGYKNFYLKRKEYKLIIS